MNYINEIKAVTTEFIAQFKKYEQVSELLTVSLINIYRIKINYKLYFSKSLKNEGYIPV